MNKHFIWVFTLFIIISSITQAEKNKDKPIKIGHTGIYGEDLITCEKMKDIYTFTYQEQNEVSVADFSSFSITQKEFDTTVQKLSEMFKNPPKEDIKLVSTNSYVWVEYAKFMGITAFRFNKAKSEKAISVSYSSWISKKKFLKLVGQ